MGDRSRSVALVPRAGGTAALVAASSAARSLEPLSGRPVVILARESAAAAPDLLDAASIAAALGLSKWTIYRWSTQGRIPAVRLGRKTRFELDRVVEALRSATPEPRRTRHGRARHTRPARRLVRAFSSTPVPPGESLSHEERLRAAIEATRALGR